MHIIYQKYLIGQQCFYPLRWDLMGFSLPVLTILTKTHVWIQLLWSRCGMAIPTWEMLPIFSLAPSMHITIHRQGFAMTSHVKIHQFRYVYLLEIWDAELLGCNKLYCWSIDYIFLTHCWIENCANCCSFCPLFYPTMTQERDNQRIGNET